MKGEGNSRLGLVSCSVKGTWASDKREPVIAKAAVDCDGQSQTKPTPFLGPFFPSSSRPRPFKSIFFHPFLSFLFSLFLLHLPDDRLLHFFPHGRPLFPKVERLCAQWFKSFPREQPPLHHPHYPQEAHGIRRFRKSSKPGPPQEREEGFSVHRNGRWCVPSEWPSFPAPLTLSLVLLRRVGLGKVDFS